MKNFEIVFKGNNGKERMSCEAANRKEAMVKAFDNGAIVIKEIFELVVA